MKVLKWVVVIVVLITAFHKIREYARGVWEEEFSPDNKHDVVDGFIGRQAYDNYKDIRDKQDTYNLPAFRTSVMMFYTQNGRYPQSVEEMERSGDANPSITHDRYGSPFGMKFDGNILTLTSPGRDRIKDTTDDVEYKLKM